MRFPVCLHALLLLAIGLLVGCDGMTAQSFNLNKAFIDPSEVSVTTHTKGPLLVPILEKVAPDYEETDEIFTQATDVRPEDLMISSGDYPIGISDLLSISITDLVQPGVETNKQARVSESGKISLPLIGQLQAEGLTEAQLEQEIVAAYRDQQIITNAQVSVQVVVAQSRTFSILGSVQQAGQYAIPRNDFRLLDALVSARDLTVDTDIRGNKGIDNIFVLRKVHPEGGATTLPERDDAQAGDGAPVPTPDLLTPRGPSTQPGSKQMLMLQTSGTAANEPAATGPANSPAPTTAAANTGEEGAGAANRAAPTTGPTPVPADVEGRYIIGPDGKPQYVGGVEPPPGAPTTANAPFVPNPNITGPGTALPPGATDKFVFNDLKSPIDTRIIRVPVAALKQGDLRYNIIIRPDDMIIVRPPTQGEYYMGGHVARVGVYSLTARKITLTQAVISAGMLDQLAVPGRAQIIRRIGSDHQCFVRVDLEKIFEGVQPDIYLKPDDQVLVGTNGLAPFIAAIRGGFRFTYGFGFIYDRNYSYTNNTTGSGF